MRHHLVKAKSVRTGLRKLRLYYLGTALSYPKHSSCVFCAQGVRELYNRYERDVSVIRKSFPWIRKLELLEVFGISYVCKYVFRTNYKC